jgi:acylphosphatase
VKRRLEVLVAGRVQGVFFRASTREEARRLHLDGFVRNLTDGRVHGVFEGDEAALERMLRWCREGPAGSRVDRVESTWTEATGELGGFTIRY